MKLLDVSLCNVKLLTPLSEVPSMSDTFSDPFFPFFFFFPFCVIVMKLSKYGLITKTEKRPYFMIHGIKVLDCEQAFKGGR